VEQNIGITVTDQTTIERHIDTTENQRSVEAKAVSVVSEANANWRGSHLGNRNPFGSTGDHQAGKAENSMQKRHACRPEWMIVLPYQCRNVTCIEGSPQRNLRPLLPLVTQVQHPAIIH
jgi:hypothetical protein